MGNQTMDPIDFHSMKKYNASQWVPSTVWLPTQNKFIQVYRVNYDRISISLQMKIKFSYCTLGLYNISLVF